MGEDGRWFVTPQVLLNVAPRTILQPEAACCDFFPDVADSATETCVSDDALV